MTRVWYPAMIRAIHVSLAKYDFSLVPGHLNKQNKQTKQTNPKPKRLNKQTCPKPKRLNKGGHILKYFSENIFRIWVAVYGIRIGPYLENQIRKIFRQSFQDPTSPFSFSGFYC